jgi:putrescine transport system permease protein
MRLYSQVRLGVDPKINAISTILIGLVATGVIATYLVQQRAARRGDQRS